MHGNVPIIIDVGDINLEPLNKKLNVVTGQPVHVLGRINVKDSFQWCYMACHYLLFDPIENALLLDKDWLDIIFSSWRSMFSLNAIGEIKQKGSSRDNSHIDHKNMECLITQVKSKYSLVFPSKVDQPIKHFNVSLVLKDGPKKFLENHIMCLMLYS